MITGHFFFLQLFKCRMCWRWRKYYRIMRYMSSATKKLLIHIETSGFWNRVHFCFVGFICFWFVSPIKDHTHKKNVDWGQAGKAAATAARRACAFGWQSEILVVHTNPAQRNLQKVYCYHLNMESRQTAQYTFCTRCSTPCAI